MKNLPKRDIEKLLQAVYSNPSSIGIHSNEFIDSKVEKKQGEFLNRFIKKERPKRILEVGYGYGVSTLWVLSAHSKISEYVIVDPYRHEPYENDIYRALQTHSGVNIEETKSSQVLLAELSNSKKQFDLIFLDGDERFDGCLVDLFFSEKLLIDGGHIILRNIWNPSVRKVVLFFLLNRVLQCPQLTTFDMRMIRLPFFGSYYLYFKLRQIDFCILQKSGSLERSWNHFVNFF